MILFEEDFIKDIIWAIRELFKGDKGFENMFDKSKSGGKLASLTGGNRDAEPFNDTVKKFNVK